MSDWRKMEVNGVTVYFNKYWCGHPDISELFTKFYTLEGKKPEKKWNWRKFKKTPTGNMIDNFVERFELSFDIENPEYTKGYVRKKIEHQVELMGRAGELKRGEII